MIKPKWVIMRWSQETIPLLPQPTRRLLYSLKMIFLGWNLANPLWVIKLLLCVGGFYIEESRLKLHGENLNWLLSKPQKPLQLHYLPPDSGFCSIEQTVKEKTPVLDIDGSYLYQKYRSFAEIGKNVKHPDCPSKPLCGWRAINKDSYQNIALLLHIVPSGTALSEHNILV